MSEWTSVDRPAEASKGMKTQAAGKGSVEF